MPHDERKLGKFYVKIIEKNILISSSPSAARF